jgi:hypothetical protein
MLIEKVILTGILVLMDTMKMKFSEGLLDNYAACRGTRLVNIDLLLIFNLS